MFSQKWKRVWLEDDCTLRDPDAERWPAAWRRLFSSEPPPVTYSAEILPIADAHADLGDADAFLLGDRVVMSSFDGFSLWVPIETAPDSSGPSGERP